MRSRWQLIDHVALFAASLALSLLFAAPALSQALDVCRPGPSVTSPEGPRPLTEQGMRNAIAFTRLLGYVRHFHPSDQASVADWDTLAVEGMRQIEPCEGPDQLAKALDAYFRSVAPTMQVFPNETQPAAPTGLAPPAGAAGLKRVSWLHLGPGNCARRMRPSIGVSGLMKL